nr:DNA-binding response regulator [Bacteroidota bacterium]
MKISCIIADDEPLSQDVLKQYIADTPQLQIYGVFDNAIQAMEFLAGKNVDLMFLDINMPKLSGINLVKSLVNPPLIVFTTAYPQFAVEGFELDAVDYLLKPFSFERFLKAVSKVAEKISMADKSDTGRNYILVKADKKLHRINLDEILYLESAGDYVKIFFTDQMVMVHDTLKNMVLSLPEPKFFRLHRSFLVAVGKISYIEGNQVKIGEVMVPVSPERKEELLRLIQDD